MTSCPSDEKLASLLADRLSAAECDALAAHIEKCASCQAKLARLSESSDANAWRPATQTPPCCEVEEGIIGRLKLARPSMAFSAANPSDTPTLDIAQGRPRTSATFDFDIPSVPGYEIIEILGRGGMGVVFKARQLALQRMVALKMFQDWAHADEKELTRFRAEADVIARLQHPNIVQIYDVGDVAGRPYFVLEYVAGGNLAQHLNGTPQSARLAAQFVEELARAVQAAHANGVVHRDLKPSNILLISTDATAAGSLETTRNPGVPSWNESPLKAIPKIADFGLAKIAYGELGAQHRRNLTVTGEIIGTPSYMAPEQAAPSRQPVGPATDVYALGAILYELLTGRPPFKGETPLDTVLQVLHSEPVSVTALQPTIPGDLETICLKCLRKEPINRYLTASELADDIQRFLAGKPINARPRGTVEKVWRWIRDHPIPSGMLAAGVLTPIVALIILSLLSARLIRSSPWKALRSRQSCSNKRRISTA